MINRTYNGFIGSIMSNIRGPNFGHRCYELIDPRDARTRYVGFGSGIAPWLAPRVHAQSDVAAWLAELRGLGLTPSLSWDGVPSCWFRKDAAKWVARSRRQVLIAAGFSVLTGFGPAWKRPRGAVGHLRQPRVTDYADRAGMPPRPLAGP